MNILKKIAHIYNKCEEYLLVGSLIFTVGLVFYQIIMRYVFSNSSFWSEELVRYVFIWQIWLGASIGFRDDKHIKIEILTDHLRGKVKIFCSLICNLLLIAFCVFLIKEGWNYLVLTSNLNKVTPALRIPFVFVYASLPVSSLVVGLRLLGSVAQEVAALVRPLPPVEGGEA